MKLRILPSQRTPGEGHPAAGRLRVASLAEALLAEYRTDAHVVAYAADDSPTGDRRLVQASLARGARPRMVLGLVDVDSPQEHRGEDGEASPAWRAEQAARVDRLLADAPGLVAYETRKGYRLVGLLPEPVVIASDADAARWRATYLRRLAVLAREYGIVGDAACSDWTRLYRLPHATRAPAQGPEHRPLRGDPHRLGAWPALVDAPEALAADVATMRSTWGSAVAAHVAPAPPAAPRAPRSRATVAPAIVADLGRLYGAARALAEALAELPRGLGERHGALLACVGALFDAGWTAAAVRRVMGDVADALGDAREEVASAINSTLRRRDAQLPYTGLATLRELAPRAAEALRTCETPAERARRALGNIPQVAELTPDEASRELAGALREAREARKLSVLAVTTGAGKTHTACEDARDAARAGRRTAILACSHAVAAETVERLRAWGVAAAHLRGVLSVVDGEGRPVCRHAESAEALSSAGVGTVSTMCDGRGYAPRTPRGQRRLPIADMSSPRGEAPCEHRTTCAAYDLRQRERDALADAQVLVTVHALADDAHRWLAEAPEGALAVIDEAPELLVASALTAAELAAAAEAIGARRSAVTRAEAWRADVLRAASRGLSAAPEGASVAQVLRAGLAVAEGSLVATLPDDAAVADLLARWARDSGQTRTGRPRRQIAPRPARRVVDEARRRAGVPAQVVDAIRVAGLVARALAAELAGGPSCASTVGTREHGDVAGARELRLTATAAPLRALLADASVGRVVLDATAPPSADLLAAAAGVPAGTVATRSIAVRDGATVERIYVPWSHASRRACLPGGTPEWTELRGPLREGLRLAAEGLPRGARLLAVTWQVVTRAIAASDADAELRAELAELAERGITVEWAHYGSTRGVDRWRDVDAVLAVGTPWPDESAVAQVVAASGLPAEGTRECARHLARAELAQVIGRLRAPRRTRDARVVVVASVTPLGADARWQVRELAAGRPARNVDVPEGVTHAAAAAAAGVSRSTIKRRRREAREAEGGGSKPVTEAYVTGCEPPPSRGVGDTNRRKIGLFERRPLEPDTPDPPLGDAPLVARAAPVPVPEARARSG